MMTNHRNHSLILFIMLLTHAFAVFADDDVDLVRKWLDMMSRSAQSLSYQGTFVYHSNKGMSAMQITHIVDVNGPMEKLVSLNGEHGEVVRNHTGVKCTIPHQSPMVLDRGGFDKAFPEKLLERIERLGMYYHLATEGQSRVAGRMAQIISILPKDSYRYGYRIWVDKRVGLLLEAQLINEKGLVIEQLMYTSIKIFDEGIPESLKRSVVADKSGERSAASVVGSPSDDSEAEVDWRVMDSDIGFSLARYHRQNRSDRPDVDHLVFTDGLASVSVFIDKDIGQQNFSGSSLMGAVNAYGEVRGRHHVTTVGEAPIATLQLISNSLDFPSQQ